ncbi:hypothetical protein Taro_023533 [Colocasia esculenta]|uniref:Uncharacterized protein n=1 Tax=Colocasia esculenta TaxID=4460 RepID=A0A843UXN7_COLES|nr:hypothetical protein [Colocasia esculenta]
MYCVSNKNWVLRHSAGCLVSVDAYFEAPERIAAIILVAPAIVAPFMQRNMKKESEKGKGLQNEDGRSTTNIQWNPFIVIWRLLSRLAAVIAQAAMRIIKGMKDMIGSLRRNILTAMLRSTISIILVRMLLDKFGVVAIRNAWCDRDQVTDHVIHGYTKPLKTKGWEVALLEYTLAMLTNSASESKPPLTRRLAEISCPGINISSICAFFKIMELLKLLQFCFEIVRCIFLVELH